MNRFTRIISENGTYRNKRYKEVYVYFLGALIYKIWFIDDEKVASRMFYEGEGPVHLRNKRIG